MVIRTIYAVFLLSITLITGLFFVVGCDQEKRHELLQFFVDGVPPFGGWDPNDPNSPDYRNPLDPNLANSSQQPVYISGSLHKTKKPCEFCHGEKGQQTYSKPIHLVEKVPDLCYNCHKDHIKAASHVHGPVAVGQCLFCHLPHRSKNRYLLKKTVPYMCFTCHDEDKIIEIPGHRKDLIGKCNFCHHVHSGPQKGLLKMNSKRGTRIDYNLTDKPTQ